MAKMNKNMTIGVALLIALALMYIPIPLINGDIIAKLAILIIALYMLFTK